MKIPIKQAFLERLHTRKDIIMFYTQWHGNVAQVTGIRWNENADDFHRYDMRFTMFGESVDAAAELDIYQIVEPELLLMLWDNIEKGDKIASHNLLLGMYGLPEE